MCSKVKKDAKDETVGAERHRDSGLVQHYVMVTTSSIERMMRRAGFAVTRFGSPMRIGVENAVALDFDIGEQTHEALFGTMLEAA